MGPRGAVTAPTGGPFFSYAAGAMWLSDLWFGLVTLWLGIVSRISALALVVGSLFAFPSMESIRRAGRAQETSKGSS